MELKLKKLFIGIGITLRWLWKLLSMGSRIMSTLFFLLMIAFILTLFIKPRVKVPEGAALIISPAGNIVETKTAINPIARFVNEIGGIQVPEETRLQDILDTINAGARDKRIKIMLLSLSKMNRAGINQLRAIGHSIENFKKTGKLVIAADDRYNQSQYYLASFADTIYMNPMGAVGLRGFGVFRLYMKELLDRFAVNFHVFKVGSYKSALEPFTRNEMSAEAKEENRLWLSNLWKIYCKDIAEHRSLTPEKINSLINEMPDYLRRSGGNAGRMALDTGLIDGLKTNQEIEDELIRRVGRSDDDKTFKQIQFTDYLTTITPSFVGQGSEKNRIGLIVAEGAIVSGEKITGQIDSTALCRKIRHVREDKKMKALVLRIDSGGGSAFASEQIRQELLLVKKSGKPVVVSMGSMAASGAYWISADADRIIASPVTLTGSIGIFGFLPTFEKSLAKIGIFSDGTGTTSMAGAGNPLRPLSPALQDTIQQGVEEGYSRFLSIVAQGRNMPTAEVEQLAQGRVWDGATALKLGLIDKLGDLNDAIREAAGLAGVSDYAVEYVQPDISTAQQFLRKLANRGAVFLERHHLVSSGNPVRQAIKQQLDFSLLTTDPAHIYALCPIPRSGN